MPENGMDMGAGTILSMTIIAWAANLMPKGEINGK